MIEPPHRKPGVEPAMKRPLIISVSIHLALVLLAIFGLPQLIKNTEIVEAVPIEIVADIGEITTTNKPPVKAPPKQEKKQETPPPPQKTPPKPQPPKKESAPPPEAALKAPPKDNKKDEVALKKEEPKKQPEKKPVKKTEPKKDTKKQEEQDFEKLLNSISDADPPKPETPDSQATKPSNPSPSPNVSKFSDVLSMSERDALIAQLAGCWNIMAGSANAEDLAVEVRVTINPDRTVREAKIVDQGRYASDAFFRAAADSALRALRNPRCTPLNLPPEKYSEWQTTVITFDPKDMF